MLNTDLLEISLEMTAKIGDYKLKKKTNPSIVAEIMITRFLNSDFLNMDQYVTHELKSAQK